MSLRYFGTDGFRGEANKTLTAEYAYAIGLFLGGWLLKNRSKALPAAIIGKDTRLSGYLFESALASGLCAGGADVHLMHVTSTPSVAYAVTSKGYGCGVMISASHNPYYDNGIKLFGPDGEKLGDSLLAEIEEGIVRVVAGKREGLPFATRERIGRAFDGGALVKEYADYLVSLAKKRFDGMRIALDCANGSAYSFGPRLLRALGAEVTAINNKPNGININDNCGSLHLEGLRECVLHNGLDVGFAFDGDADRCIAIDEKGNIVNGDGILYLSAVRMKKEGMLGDAPVVTTTMANLGLFQALDAIGVRYVKTDVGDRFVHEEMKRRGALLGGEQCGHIIFGDCFSTGDGVLTAIKVLEAMSKEGQTLSSLVKKMKIYPQTLINVPVKDKEKAMMDVELTAFIKQKERDLATRGRILVRPSGTEPLIRVMVEAATKEEAENIADSIASFIEERHKA